MNATHPHTGAVAVAPATPPAPAASLPVLVRSLRAMPRAVWVLYLGTFLNKFGTFVMPFLAIYMTRLGYSLPQAGLAISAYGLGNLVASAVGGHLADTLGRRKTIVISMVAGAASMMMLSQARSLAAFVALAGLTGLAAELYRPASQALLADLVPAGRRVTAFAGYRLALNAGFAFGPATAGFLANHSFFWLFVGDAATSVLFGIVAWRLLPQGVHARRKEAGWGELFAAVRHDRLLARVLAAALLVSLAFQQMTTTFGLHVTSLGLDATMYGALISLNGVLVVLLELPMTLISGRMIALRSIGLGYALVGLGFGMNALAGPLPALVASVVIFTLGEMLAMPVSAAFVADLAPPHLRGRYMGTLGLTWSLGCVLAPSLGMALFGLGPVILWTVCGMVGLIAAGILLTAPRARAK